MIIIVKSHKLTYLSAKIALVSEVFQNATISQLILKHEFDTNKIYLRYNFIYDENR